MKVTLVITTYNWPEALNLVLLSVEKQTKLPDEVVIADDGSGEETKKLIDEWKNHSTLNLIHVWHEDLGWRKSKILNKAISKSFGDYIIQIDGDCIVHKSFVENHVKFSKKRTFLFGSRVNIQESYLKELYKNSTLSFNFFSKGIKKRNRTIFFPMVNLFKKGKPKLSSKLRGCNTSFWRSDFLIVNGYDEKYEGWGTEDSDLALRFLNSNMVGKRLKNAIIVYHIWHPEASSKKSKRNVEIFLARKSKNPIEAVLGVDQYVDA